MLKSLNPTLEQGRTYAISKTKIGNHETEQRARVTGNARPPKIGETQKAYTGNQ